MTTNSKKTILLLVIALFLLLGACSNNEEDTGHEGGSDQEMKEEMDGMGHDDMNHSSTSTGEVPEGLKEAANPTYPVGSKAIIQDDHMKGMKGAEALISGAYETVVYTVTYTPTTGGEKVKDHKWVIHEEVADYGEEPYASGDEVVLDADHMEGMKDATATVESAEETTVYMVDFTPVTGGEEVKNHKWVTESELSPAE
ncbi:YdhK family protein [Rossellomorea sp. NPDC071047]|uniref:YdhK family protein n=1 Tax=Rossellomorea sp. NPDC071047 TaxID=3390675 RepID=UPI003D00389E